MKRLLLALGLLLPASAFAGPPTNQAYFTYQIFSSCGTILQVSAWYKTRCYSNNGCLNDYKTLSATGRVTSPIYESSNPTPTYSAIPSDWQALGLTEVRATYTNAWVAYPGQNWSAQSQHGAEPHVGLWEFWGKHAFITLPWY